jgi:hypothetical protein
MITWISWSKSSSVRATTGIQEPAASVLRRGPRASLPGSTSLSGISRISDSATSDSVPPRNAPVTSSPAATSRRANTIRRAPSPMMLKATAR